MTDIFDIEMVADNFMETPEYIDMENLRRGDKIVFSSMVRGLLGYSSRGSEFMVWNNSPTTGIITLNEVRILRSKLLEYLFYTDYRIVKSEGYDPLLFVD